MEYFRTLLKITSLDAMKSYLVIIGPNSYEKLIKIETVFSDALPLYQMLKQSDNWLCRYSISNITKRYKKCRPECSLGVNLVIDNLFM